MDEVWMADAKCAGMDPTLFDWKPNNPRLEQNRARTLCEGCPVLMQCARYAHQIRPTETIYAGIAFPALPRSGRDGRAGTAYRKLDALVRGVSEKKREGYCRNNHEMQGDNILNVVIKGKPYQRCKTCRDASEARRRKRDHRAKASA